MDTSNQNNNSGRERESLKFLRESSIPQNNARPQQMTPSAAGNSQGNHPAEPSVNAQNNRPARPAQTAKPSIGNNLNNINQAGEALIQNTGIWQNIKSKLISQKAGEPGATRQKIMIVLIPILAIIMIFLFRQVLSKSPRQVKAETNEQTPAANAKKTSGEEIIWQIPDPIKISLKEQAKSASEDNSIIVIQNQNDANNGETMIVKAILFSNDKPSVVIGNRIVHLNDEIDGMKITEINKEYVVFEKDGIKQTKKVADTATKMELEKDNKISIQPAQTEPNDVIN
jgi:hypothetical protein